MLRLGLIGSRQAAEQYAQHAPRLINARFTAVADSDGGSAREGAQRLGAANAAGSVDELFTRHEREFDAVVIQSSGLLRHQHALQAARAKKHLLIEAPLAPSVAEADAVIDACREAGVCLMVGHPSRFLPSMQAVKSSLDRGQLGKPALVRIHRWEPQSTDTGEVTTEPPWRRVVHELDLAQWLFGCLPDYIYAVPGGEPAAAPPVGRASQPGRYLQIHLGFPDGGMGLIDRAQTLPAGDSYFALTLVGTSGAAYSDDHDNMHLLYRGGAPTALRAQDRGLARLGELREFVNSILEHREPAVGGSAGRAAVQIAAAALESATNARPVSWTGAAYELV